MFSQSKQMSHIFYEVVQLSLFLASIDFNNIKCKLLIKIIDQTVLKINVKKFDRKTNKHTVNRT